MAIPLYDSSQACAWLSSKGFNPADPLMLKECTKQNHSWSINTSMFEACVFGELDVCRYVFDNGGKETIHIKSNMGVTTVMAACENGHLDVAKWLVGVGSTDLRTQVMEGDYAGKSLVFFACKNNDIEMAQWLVDLGAADDIPIKRKYVQQHGLMRIFDKANAGVKPAFFVPCKMKKLEMTKWLVLHGGMALRNGKTDAGYLKDALQQAAVRDNGAYDHQFTHALHSWTTDLLSNHAAFMVLLPPAALDQSAKLRLGHLVELHGLVAKPELNGLFGVALRFSMDRVVVQLQGRSGSVKVKHVNLRLEGGSARQCPLHLLRGHEGSVLQAIAEFAGVVLGRRLKLVRGACKATGDCIAEGDPEPIVLPEFMTRPNTIAGWNLN